MPWNFASALKNFQFICQLFVKAVILWSRGSGITDGCSLTAVCLEKALCFQKLVSFADGHGVDTEIGCHLADGRKRFPRLKLPSPDSFDNLVAQLKVDRDFGLHVDLDDHISASPFCEI